MLAVPERHLGSYPDTREGLPDGPLLLVVGGMHGNEPAGVLAARRVLCALAEARPAMRGALVALAGNLGALGRGTRYVECDLNRAWTDDGLAASREDSAEGREQRELAALLLPLLGAARGEVTLLDLHSTSAPGAPFVIMGDTLQNRRVAFRLGVPVILGLEERVEGTLLAYISDLGHTAVCLEGGQNESPLTVAHHEAAIWITLVGLGMLRAADAPDLEGQRARLSTAARGLPGVVEVRHREPVPPGEPFIMQPGFANFDRVRRGEPLARVGPPGRQRELVSPIRGLLLMPRYQGQGDDAYFLGREVRRFWLSLSALMRRLRLEVLLPYLPGVQTAPAQARVLRVDPRIARIYTLEILHLFGYRRSAKEGPLQVYVRRRDAL